MIKLIKISKIILIILDKSKCKILKINKNKLKYNQEHKWIMLLIDYKIKLLEKKHGQWKVKLKLNNVQLTVYYNMIYNSHQELNIHMKSHNKEILNYNN